MQAIKLSEGTAARRRIPVYLVDSTDGVTPETGLAGSAAVTVSENGAAFAAAAGTFAEVANGLYYYQAAAAELDTPGFLAVRVTDAAARTFLAVVHVVAYDPHDAAALGLSRLDVALSTLSTAAALAAAAGDVTTLVGRLTVQRTANLDNLDAAVSSRASVSALSAVAGNVLAAIDGITAINADTDDIQARIPAALVGGRMDASVGAVAANAITAAALAADAGTEIAEAVTDQTLTGHSTAGTVGGALAGAATSTALGAVATAVAALPSAAAVAAAVLAATLEGARTVGEGLRILLRVAAGRRIVAGDSVTYRDLANSKNAVVSTVDADGNRAAASTLDGT